MMLQQFCLSVWLSVTVMHCVEMAKLFQTISITPQIVKFKDNKNLFLNYKSKRQT